MSSSVLTSGALALNWTYENPESWSTLELDDGRLAVLAPESELLFRANWIASVRVPEEPIAPTEAIALIRQSRDQEPGVEVLGENVFQVGDRDWFITEYAFVHPEAGTLVRAVWATGHLGDSPWNVILTGTCAADPAGAELKRLRDVVTGTEIVVQD